MKGLSRRGMIPVIAAALLISSTLSADPAGLFIEAGHAFSLKPKKSGGGDLLLPDDPETYSPATGNNGDNTVFIGYNAPLYPQIGGMQLTIGGRYHFQDTADYEADFVARFGYLVTEEWTIGVGGGFGFGHADLGFDSVTFSGKSGLTNQEVKQTIDFPDDQDYSTGFFHLVTSYTFAKHWTASITYEIKETVFEEFDGSREQIDWSGMMNPVMGLTILEELMSYESTTHSAIISFRYTF